MSLNTKIPRRRMDQVINDLIEALGGYEVAAATCLVSTDMVNKWKQNPNASGQTIPVKHLQALLTAAGQNLHNLLLQNATDELLQDHFLNLCHRRAYPEEKVFQFIELLGGQKPTKAINE